MRIEISHKLYERLGTTSYTVRLDSGLRVSVQYMGLTRNFAGPIKS
jgi:hypothetical protein